MIDNTINDDKTIAGDCKDDGMNYFRFGIYMSKANKGDTMNWQKDDSQIVKRSHLQ